MAEKSDWDVKHRHKINKMKTCVRYSLYKLSFQNHISVCPMPSKHVQLGHYRPTSEMPFKWRFTGGLIVARDWMLAG